MEKYKKLFHTDDMTGDLKENIDEWCNNSSGHIIDGLYVDEEMQELNKVLYDWLLANGAEVDDEVYISNNGRG